MNRVQFCRTLDRAAALLPEGNPERTRLYDARAKFTTTDGDPETGRIKLLRVRKRLLELRNYLGAVELIN